MRTNEENGMMQIMADARREALQASMLTARIIDLPAFVKAIGIIRTEDAKLTNGFISAILAYVNTPSSETLNRAWNKLAVLMLFTAARQSLLITETKATVSSCNM